MARSPRKSTSAKSHFGGTHAILGVDIVSFSTFHDEDQIDAIKRLILSIDRALKFHGIGDDEYRWSPAGDGGYLTFGATAACRKAVDVAFSLCKQVNKPDWRPRSGEKIEIRLALHAGPIQEAREIGRDTNVWGIGINTAARILSLSTPSQLLVSKAYYDTYIRGQREGEFEISEPHWRTVKHGHQVEVMNFNQDGLCLARDDAHARQWHGIGDLWRHAIEEYVALIHDAMKSGDVVAALAAAKFLLDLGHEAPARELFDVVGHTSDKPAVSYPYQSHPLFSQMPSHVLYEVISGASVRRFRQSELLCEKGDSAASCYFPVSGTIVVDLGDAADPIRIPKGALIGEFSLWISNIRRTATLRALDDGLFLEIHNGHFKKVLDQWPDVAQAVNGIVKQRILENTLRSKSLFPKATELLTHHPWPQRPRCEKHDAGAQLDLTRCAHVIFSGKVRTSTPDGIASLDVVGPAQFGCEPVVGIISPVGAPDGASALVLEEAVAVAFPRELLVDIQGRLPDVANAWNSLYGQRMGQYLAQSQRGHNAEAAPDEASPTPILKFKRHT